MGVLLRAGTYGFIVTVVHVVGGFLLYSSQRENSYVELSAEHHFGVVLEVISGRNSEKNFFELTIFLDRVSLYSTSWSGTDYVEPAGLNQTHGDQPASVF